MDFSLKDGLSFRQMGVISGVAVLLVTGITFAVHFEFISSSRAGLLMDALLTAATFGYVFLTYGMVSQMRRDIEVRERHHNRPHVIERLESDLLPLRRDLQQIRRVVKDGEAEWDGPNGVIVDGEQYRAFHESNARYGLRTIPRFTTHIDLDNGVVYDAYRAVEDYQDTYQEAVMELQSLVLEELDGREMDSKEVRSFAVLALKIEGDGGVNRWWKDHWQDDVIELRDEMPETMRELAEARDNVITKCGEASREINQVLDQVLNDYEISDAELEPDAGPERTRVYESNWK